MLINVFYYSVSTAVLLGVAGADIPIAEIEKHISSSKVRFNTMFSVKILLQVLQQEPQQNLRLN